MTVIVRDEHGNIVVFLKGADSSCLPLLRGYDEDDEKAIYKTQENWEYTESELKKFADQGLRTLLVCSATKRADWWDHPDHGMGIK